MSLRSGMVLLIVALSAGCGSDRNPASQANQGKPLDPSVAGPMLAKVKELEQKAASDAKQAGQVTAKWQDELAKLKAADNQANKEDSSAPADENSTPAAEGAKPAAENAKPTNEDPTPSKENAKPAKGGDAVKEIAQLAQSGQLPKVKDLAQALVGHRHLHPSGSTGTDPMSIIANTLSSAGIKGRHRP